ncbi:hypothetical protein D5S17_35955 [Pseudonocardiaceae bacterium YIM PH 21723]|nr:hypothetical protein D5S17_35955 [Pseudonocardiaceae bacterium YIM PH 21723]
MRMWGKPAVAAAVLATVIGLSGCAAPQPPTGTPAPKLNPDLVAYDNIGFQVTRPRVYIDEKMCAGLPADIGPKIGMASEPFDTRPSGCGFKESWGLLTIAQSTPSERASRQRFFADYWNGKQTYGTAYSRRFIINDTYLAIKSVGKTEYGGCTVTIDTGNTESLVIVALPPSEDADVYRKQDKDFPKDKAIADFCSKAVTVAEKLLPVIDPGGGSLRTP